MHRNRIIGFVHTCAYSTSSGYWSGIAVPSDEHGRVDVADISPRCCKQCLIHVCTFKTQNRWNQSNPTLTLSIK
jgi:hypothetical protein